MLFGAPTESKDKLLAHGAGADDPSGDEEASTPAGGTAAAAEGDEAKKRGRPKKGHGRNGAEKYVDSPVIEVAVPDLKPGDPCPECLICLLYTSRCV